MALKEVEVLGSGVIQAMLCGSRVTCDPAPTDTDQDVIVLVRAIEATLHVLPREVRESQRAEYWAMRANMCDKGWMLGGSSDGEDAFESWTRGDINLILVSDPEFYNRFVSATTVCAHLNLLEKEDRKKVFRSVLYSENVYRPDESGKQFVEIPF